MQDDLVLETWLIDVGGGIVEKKSSQGGEALTLIETAIYDLWLIDYAVRNSGSLGPLDDMQSDAVASLHAFSVTHGLPTLASWLSQTNDEAKFCETYHHHFAGACLELKQCWAST